MFKTGYVGIVGKTNVGKSTLVNALVGEKVSIVTPKTQTTRQNITGILTRENYQIVFVDTPGIHKSQNNLDRFMMKNVRSAIGSVDILVYVVDCTKKLDKHELENITKYALDESLQTILVVSKIDLISKNALLSFLANFTEIKGLKAILPLSARRGLNTKELITEILKLLPESEEKNFVYEDDLYTDSSVRFMSAEIVREKALLKLNEELPHGLAIEITKFDETDTIAYIDMDLICEKENHKSIILGKRGEMLKEIGTLARVDIENLLGKKIMLKIFVKVDKNWRQKKISMV
ncbi:MAG: GTPase Era [Clostridia bacterium]|nr:GTPase Era [Clostridia bacterium]